VKDHVTLKTGVMMINSALITAINYTFLHYNNISLFLLYRTVMRVIICLLLKVMRENPISIFRDYIINSVTVSK